MISATVTNPNHTISLAITSAKAIPDRVARAGAIALERSLLLVAGVVQRRYLSGPRPTLLDIVTGRLRNSIATNVQALPNTIRGTIGSNVAYAAYHEFGFHGTINVKAHSRVISQITGTGQAIDTRRAVRDEHGNFLAWRETRKRAARKQETGAVGVQFVKAHARNVDYAGKPYVGPALRASTPLIIDEIKAELAKL